LTAHDTTRGFRVRRLPGDPAPVLAVAGDLDVYEAPGFRNELEAIVDEGHRRVVVDCSAMTFIDSAGLAALVDMRRRLDARDGVLVLRSLSARSRRIFEITDLERLFEFE
jgi:anti-sigma B factor antagonist